MNTSSPAWIAIGWTMVHLLWVGALIGLAGALLRRLLRGRSPEARHGAALACFAGLAAAPLLLFAILYRPGTGEPIGRLPDIEGQPIAADFAAPEAEPIEQARPLPWSLAGEAAGPSTLAARLRPMVERLPAVWLAGSVVMLLWFVAGLIGVERMRRSCLVLDTGPLADRCRELSRSLGLARRVGVAVCDRLATPLLVGVVRPLILVPPAAVSGWDADLLEMALLHELAHLRRHDNLINLAQRLVESFLFFHPATWWLSGWLRLERESCCDALVVSYTGRPAAYARLLAGLDPPPLPLAATAMAERPLMTRIRRIMGKEDRTMRLNLTEGLGLLAVAASLSLWAASTHARPPEDPALAVLTKLAEGTGPATGEARQSQMQALAAIAKAQFALGDQEAALATLSKLETQRGPWPTWQELDADPAGFDEVMYRFRAISARWDAGDANGARAALQGLMGLYDDLPPEAMRSALESLEGEMIRDFLEEPERTEPKRFQDTAAASLLEMESSVIALLIEMGDLEAARNFIRKSVEQLERIGNSPMASLMMIHFGPELIRAGDREGGRALADRGQRKILDLKEDKLKPFYLSLLGRVTATIGELDPALALLPDIQPNKLEESLQDMIASLADPKSLNAGFSWHSISLNIGDPTVELKDPASARPVLAQMAAAVQSIENVKVQTRTLSVLARLQATTGDIEEALKTAGAMPVLRRADFPSPRDGFYDAMKPATFALVASEQAKAGDQAGADATFATASELTEAIGPDEERLAAQIVAARELIACGRRAAGFDLVAEALKLATAQPEPRRSRMLGLVVEVQMKADDLDAAERTADLMRDWPGLEKLQAMLMLGHTHQEAGRSDRAREIHERALAVLTQTPSQPDPANSPKLKSFGITRHTFLDYDEELPPGISRGERTAQHLLLLARLGRIEELKAEFAKVPDIQKWMASHQAIWTLIRNDSLEQAIELADSIETAESRLQAYSVIASSLEHGTKRR